MTIAILLFTFLNWINTFLILLVLLAIYGKCSDVIGYIEKSKDSIKSFGKGLLEGLNKDTHKR